MKTAFAIGAALTVLCAAPAIAQNNISAGVINAAVCIADNEPSSAKAVLATVPGSPAETIAHRKLASILSACSADDPLETVDLPWVRPALAAAMLEKPLARGRRPKANGPLWFAAMESKAAGQGYDAAALGWYRMGACVFAAAPDAAGNLLASAPRSREERGAFAALKPALGPCVIKGRPIAFTKTSLRLLLAEPVYHAISG